MENNKLNEPLFKLRYEFEHMLIPNWFYTQTEDFAEELKKSEDSVDKLFYKLCYDKNIKDEWIGQYQCSFAFDKENNINALVIVCPKVEVSTNCKYIFILYNDTNKLVLTYEYEDMISLFEANGGNYMICAWDENKMHRNYGRFKGDDFELIEKIKEIFKKDCKGE